MDDKKKEVIVYGILHRKEAISDYVLDLLNKESKEKKVTRMEIIRSAIVNYLVNRDDAEDLAYIEEHKRDRLLTFHETFDS